MPFVTHRLHRRRRARRTLQESTIACPHGGPPDSTVRLVRRWWVSTSLLVHRIRNGVLTSTNLVLQQCVPISTDLSSPSHNSPSSRSGQGDHVASGPPGGGRQPPAVTPQQA